MKKQILCVILTVITVLSAFAALAPCAGAIITPYKTGDTITLGSYPQTLVTDAALIKKLNSASAAPQTYQYYAGDGSYGSMKLQSYMYYKDATVDGVKYRAINITKYRPDRTFDEFIDGGYQKDHDFETNKLYWFRFDPVEWTVLDPEKGLLISKYVLDSQAFQNVVYQVSDGVEEGYYYDEEYGRYRYHYASYVYTNDANGTVFSNRYDTSTIRTWLNSTFYNTAFTAAQKKMIVPQTLTTPDFDSESGVSYTTTDNVYLLSSEQANDPSLEKTDRWGDTYSIISTGNTDYARAQGHSGSDYSSYTNWLLRSPGSNSGIVKSFGSYETTTYTFKTSSGVRPVITVNFNDKKGGDVDGDGQITASDARLALRICVNLTYVPDEIKLFADVDGSGDVTAADARLILRYSVRLENDSALSRFLTPQNNLTGEVEQSKKKFLGEKTVGAGKKLSLGESHVKRLGLFFRWKSSNPSVASVEQDGTVTAHKKGFACVYLTNGFSRYYYYINVLNSLQERIYALQNKYPSGYYWNAHTKSSKYPAVSEIPCSDHSSGQYAYCIGQCAGFSYLMSNEVFGNAPIYRNLKVQDIKIGDYVRCLPHHSVFVIDRVNKGEIVGYDMYEDQNYTAWADEITICECNWDCRCGISWGRTIYLDNLSIDSYESFSRYK